MEQLEKNTVKSYSFLWDKEKGGSGHRTHFEILNELLNGNILREGKGLEVGCGPGFDLEYMARSYPDKVFISIDLSKSVFEVKDRLKGLKNVYLIRGSALDLPFKDKAFTFVYSFGVLHHTINPDKGMREMNRVLKDQSPSTLYLYEDHEDNSLKYIALKFITALRSISTILPNPLLYILCVLASPIVYFIFSLPALLLKQFVVTRGIYNKIPFNFGKHPFDLTGDLYDRFATPIEKRYSKKELTHALENAGFNDIKLCKIPDTAGWVSHSLKFEK